jgi:ribosomal protein S18 acetylase RimI-like enzyme
LDKFNLEIRTARIEDSPGIARVHVDSWRTTYRGIVPQDVLENLSYQQRQEIWQERLTNIAQRDCILVAQDNRGTILGFATGGEERTGKFGFDGELYAIYLLEKHQRQGIGTRLTREIASCLFQNGFTSMLVWVLAGNPSRKFYQNLGGEKVAEQGITIGGADLSEIAYGWGDINTLVNQTDQNS